MLSLAYPDLTIDFNIPGWLASGRTSYAGCRSGDFEVGNGTTHTEWRGGCLLTEIQAVVYRDGRSVRARPYQSSGTGYSQFEIVPDGGDNFCIRRVGTSC